MSPTAASIVIFVISVVCLLGANDRGGTGFIDRLAIVWVGLVAVIAFLMVSNNGSNPENGLVQVAFVGCLPYLALRAAAWIVVGAFRPSPLPNLQLKRWAYGVVAAVVFLCLLGDTIATKFDVLHCLALGGLAILVYRVLITARVQKSVIEVLPPAVVAATTAAAPAAASPTSGYKQATILDLHEQLGPSD